MEFDTKDAGVDAVVTSVASKTMGGGATASVMGWLSSNEGIAITGLMLAIAGFIVNLIFQARRDYRERVLHEAELILLVKKSEQSETKDT